MAYVEWGKPHNSQVLICVHGYTRNSRDFDFLAEVLAENYRVICPDIVGRGKSDWLDQEEGYIYATYVNDIFTLLKQLNIKKVDWLGTSMGGLIGMFIAQLTSSPIQKLILNDVGAFISQEALRKIAKYVLFGQRNFANFSEVLDHVKKTYAGFGTITESQWEHLAQHSVKLESDHSYTLNYDPKISYLLRSFPYLEAMELWEVWQKINCPIFLIHGEESDILLPATIAEMKSIKPKMQVVHIPETAHAPSLMTPEQINLVEAWLAVDPRTHQFII
jgi:pimeloyl-ACP methyl ester carboxylesterase